PVSNTRMPLGYWGEPAGGRQKAPKVTFWLRRRLTPNSPMSLPGFLRERSSSMSPDACGSAAGDALRGDGMATLTLIAEPFPDWEAAAQSAAARELADAVAATAPRSCSARFLVARGGDQPEFRSPLIRVDQLPIRATMLPYVWHTVTTAHPLDGESVHALPPTH